MPEVVISFTFDATHSSFHEAVTCNPITVVVVHHIQQGVGFRHVLETAGVLETHAGHTPVKANIQ